MYNEKFKEICTRNYGFCNTNLPCEDEFICIIDMENESFLEGYDIIQTDETGKKRNQTIKDKILDYECKVIALVLESPHTSEYNQRTPLGPGLGKTGKNIHEHIIEILMKSNLQLVDKYKIILVEAVSYQCSNGESPIDKSKRDDTFKMVWASFGENDFKCRMKDYNPYIIINSCTGGLSKIHSNDSLNGLVQSAIEELDYVHVATAHPSSTWFWRKKMI